MNFIELEICQSQSTYFQVSRTRLAMALSPRKDNLKIFLSAGSTQLVLPLFSTVLNPHIS